MISQYQETPPENRSDFYRFLYNRSKIKPLTHYFTADKKSPAKKSNQESKTPEEKLKFNFDFKKHACIAKLKEDELEEKIEKWLENVEEDREPLEEDESQEGAKMEVEEESSETNDTNKTDTTTESNKPASTLNKKKKQTFGELFGEVEAVENAAKKKITNLDVLDKLLTAEPEASESPPQKNVSMEIDIKIEKKEDKTPRSTPKPTRTKKSLPSGKKDSQMKIHDFFKKKDT